MSWMGVPEVAEYTGYSEETVYDMIHRGELRASQPRRIYKVRKQDVEDLFERNVVKPSVQPRTPRLRVAPEPGTFAARNASKGGRR